MVHFIDRKIGERFAIDAGAFWLMGEKISADQFRRDDGVVIGVSAWTKTK